MARMSIYVPDDMKKRMVAIGDEKVNWSNVAQVAFRQAIANVTFPKEPTMEDVIERLKASKENSEQQDIVSGRNRGRAWASKGAEYFELKLVADLDVRNAEFNEDEDAAAWVISRLEGANLGDFPDLFGDEPVSDAYVEGFIEGAREIWQAVRQESNSPHRVCRRSILHVVGCFNEVAAEMLRKRALSELRGHRANWR